MKAAKRGGNRDRERRFDAIQTGMKITANSICYGTGIEMNVNEHRKAVGATIYLPDGSSYRAKLKRTEQPGSRFNPLVATLATGGGRLVLVAAMDLIDWAGGVYATCDTDSVFPVATKEGGMVPCPGAPHRTADGEEAVKALSWEQLREIVNRFTALNPDSRLVPGSILEMEDENFDHEPGEQWELERLAIGSKRYTLFVRDDGRPQIVGGSEKRKRSEHGLGHLLPPNAQSPEVDDQAWKDRWWEHLLCRELGVADAEPEFFSAPAVGRLTVTSPREEASFGDYNAGKPYPEQVRPWNFLSLAHPTQTERARPAGPKVLIAPFRARPAEAACSRLDRPQQSRRRTGQDSRRPDARGSRRKRRRSQLRRLLRGLPAAPRGEGAGTKRTAVPSVDPRTSLSQARGPEGHRADRQGEQPAVGDTDAGGAR